MVDLLVLYLELPRRSSIVQAVPGSKAPSLDPEEASVSPQVSRTFPIFNAIRILTELSGKHSVGGCQRGVRRRRQAYKYSLKRRKIASGSQVAEAANTTELTELRKARYTSSKS
jgi:hypothetical protein